MDRNKRDLIIIFTSLFLTFLIGRTFILTEGYVYLAENFQVYQIQDFWSGVYPTWNENLQIFNLGGLTKTYLYAPITLALGLIGSYKLLQMIFLLMPYPIAFFSVFKLTEYVIVSVTGKKISDKHVFLPSLLAAFIFTVNPWFVLNPRNLIFRIQYSFLPLILYLFLRIINSRNNKHILYFALTTALVASYRYLAIVFLMLFVVYILHLVFSKKKFFISSKKIFVAFILIVFLSSAKFVPAIIHSFFEKPEAVASFSTNKINRETLLHIFTTKVYDWTASGFDMVYADGSHFLFIIVSAFSFIYLLAWNFKKEDSAESRPFYLLLFPLIFCVFICLSAKEVNIDFLILNLPFSDYVGRLLRHARWNMMPVVLAISIMSGLSTLFILSKIGRKGYVLIFMIFFVTCMSAWPMFTGDMNGYWRPAKPPIDYVEINKLLENESSQHHALWMPYTVRNAVWSNQQGMSETSAPSGAVAIRSSAKPSYSTWSYYFFDYYHILKDGPSLSPLPVYKGDLARIYELFNIKYLILHWDGGWTEREKNKGFTNEYIRNTAYRLNQTASVREFFKGDYSSAFYLNNTPKEFMVRIPVLVSDKLTSLGSVTFLGIKQIPALVFEDTSTDSYLNKKIDYSLLIITNNPLLETNNTNFIYPEKSLNVFSPDQEWSTSNVDYPPFQRHLQKNNIRWSWDFDYGKGFAFTYAPGAQLNLDFKINDDKTHRFLIRCFRNQEGGLLKVYLDGKPIKVNTSSEVNNFVWKRLGSYNLSAGKHTLILENVEGINAVNLLLLVPEEEYINSEKKFQERYANKTLVHVLEAENEFHGFNVNVSDEFGLKASNGEVLNLRGNSTAVAELDVARSDEYRLAVRGRGKFEIRISDQIIFFDREEMGYVYSTPFNLAQGIYAMEAVSMENDSYLDVFWLYSVSGNESLEDLFSFHEEPAEVLDFERIDATEYRVEINASEPYMLSFAEGYDPMWVAEVEGESFTPVPLYAVINGFWINKTGTYSLTIRYKPQRWFYYGLAVSLITFLSCVTYLVYKWRKNQ